MEQQSDNHNRGGGGRQGGGKGKKGHAPEATKTCADCETAKPREAFSKTQWSRDERRCLACIGNNTKEEHETETLRDVVPDEVTPLSSEGVTEFLAHAPVMGAQETLEMQPDQGCSDRGRPGTCTSLEFVFGEWDATRPRLTLHPLLFLRSMSYVAHYHKQGIDFATPSLVIQCPLIRHLPKALVAELRPESDQMVSSLRVWSFRDCPPSVNIMSHGFVFANEHDVK